MNSKIGIIAPISRFAFRLRFPVLFLLTLVLFIVDLMVPDFIPFADEILLGLATVILGNWKQRKERKKEESKPS